MRERHQCVDCSKLSPPTETGYTLISREFGWRLTRASAADGSFTLEWRCPTCWQKHKARQSTTPWEPPRRPQPRVTEQSNDDERSLTASGEHSRTVYDEEYPESSPPSRPWMPEGEAAPGSNRPLPRKGS